MINYTKETVIREERSQFEVLKRIITTYRPAVIRVGILKTGMVPFPDEKT